MKFNLNSTSKHDDDGTGDAAGKVEDVLKIVQIFPSSSSGRNILVTIVSALHLLALFLNSFRLKFFFVIYSSILALARSSRLALDSYNNLIKVNSLRKTKKREKETV